MTTMTKSAVVQARIEPGLKKEADAILAAIGLNPTTAITLFYTQLVRQRGLPLELKAPNDETLDAIDELRDPVRRAQLPSYSNVGDLMQALKQ